MTNPYDNYLGDYYEAKLNPSEGYTAFRFAKFRHNYLDLLRPQQHGTLLEIGPGMGEFLTFVTGNAAFEHVQGVDYAPDCVEHCRDQGLDVVHIDDLERWLADHEGEFSAIVMLHVLEHIPKVDTIRVLGAIRRALRPGARSWSRSRTRATRGSPASPSPRTSPTRSGSPAPAWPTC